MSNTEKPSYIYKLIRVGRDPQNANKVTTISINPSLYASAVKLFGGDPKEVGRFCREVSKSFTKNEHGSRSGYVSSRLREKLDDIRKARVSST